MGALGLTNLQTTEFSGKYKVVAGTVVPASASDTVTLTAALHGITTIVAVVATINAGNDANLYTIFPSWSGLVITIVTQKAGGTAADDWTGAIASLVVVGY